MTPGGGNSKSENLLGLLSTVSSGDFLLNFAVVRSLVTLEPSPVSRGGREERSRLERAGDTGGVRRTRVSRSGARVSRSGDARLSRRLSAGGDEET